MAIDRAIAFGLYHGRLWASVGALEIMKKSCLARASHLLRRA